MVSWVRYNIFSPIVRALKTFRRVDWLVLLISLVWVAFLAAVLSVALDYSPHQVRLQFFFSLSLYVCLYWWRHSRINQKDV